MRKVILALLLFALSMPLAAQSGKLGTISFPTSGSGKAQPAFIRGVLLLHSFEYDDAAKSFQEAQRIDPGLAMAYWGEAMTYNHPVWQQQDQPKALAALAKLGATRAERRARAKTDLEKRWMDAVETLYGEGNKERRDTLYSQQMGRLAADYAKDNEVRTFYALSLLGMSHHGRDVALYMRAAAICEEVFRENPDHPGAAHYLIHSYDDPVHGPLGLRAARAYSVIAPTAPHAQHMTSHIFLALGMWDETVASNEVASKMIGYTSGHYTLWLLYAYLQQGRYAEARGVFERMRADVATHPGYGKRLHLALARAAYMIDTREWDSDIAKTVVDTTDMDLGIFYLGLPEGWAALERGDTATVRNLVDAMGARAAKLQADTSYALSNEPNDALVMMLELKGTLLLAQQQNDAGIALLKQAAAREDSVPYDFGPPATIKPPKELLAEALLATGSAAEARVAFEQALARTPRRPVGLVGLAEAARRSGAEDEAAGALAELEKVWRGPADKRPKVVAER